MLVETFLRMQLGLKSHKVTKVEETEQYMIVHIDRLGRRLLRCGVCRQRCRKVHSVRRPREWRDLSMRKVRLKLRYRPRRVECPRCGLRVEDLPWADPWGMDRFCLLGLNVPGAAVIGVLMGAAAGYSVTPAALRAHRREKAPGRGTASWSTHSWVQASEREVVEDPWPLFRSSIPRSKVTGKVKLRSV